MPDDESTGVRERSIRLDAELAIALTEAARETGLPESALMRDWMKRGRKDWQHEQEMLAAIRRQKTGAA